MSPPRQGAVRKVRMLDSEWAWVNEEAERQGVSAAEVVRTAVRQMRWGQEGRAAWSRWEDPNGPTGPTAKHRKIVDGLIAMATPVAQDPRDSKPNGGQER